MPWHSLPTINHVDKRSLLITVFKCWWVDKFSLSTSSPKTDSNTSDSRALTPRIILSVSSWQFQLLPWWQWTSCQFHLSNECMSCTNFPWWCTDAQELSVHPCRSVWTYTLETTLLKLLLHDLTLDLSFYSKSSWEYHAQLVVLSWSTSCTQSPQLMTSSVVLKLNSL
jgi:hypothetical protein